MEATKGKMNDKTVKPLCVGRAFTGDNCMGKRICGDEEFHGCDKTHVSFGIQVYDRHGRPYSYIPEAGQINDMGRYQMRRPAGIFLFISYYFQTYGLKFTTASKNAFITTLYVIIVPFLHWFLTKVKPSGKII